MEWDLKPNTIRINKAVRSLIEDLFNMVWNQSLSSDSYEKQFSLGLKEWIKEHSILTKNQYCTLLNIYEECSRRKFISSINLIDQKSTSEAQEPTNEQVNECSSKVQEVTENYRCTKKISKNSNYIAVGCYGYNDGYDSGTCNDIFLFDTKDISNYPFSRYTYKTINEDFTFLFCFSPDEKFFLYVDNNTLPAGPLKTELIQINVVYLRTKQVFKIFPDVTTFEILRGRRRNYSKFSNSGRYLAIITWYNGVQLYDANKLFSLILEIKGHTHDNEPNRYRSFETSKGSCRINLHISNIHFSDDESCLITYAEYGERITWQIPNT